MKYSLFSQPTKLPWDCETFSTDYYYTIRNMYCITSRGKMKECDCRIIIKINYWFHENLPDKVDDIIYKLNYKGLFIGYIAHTL